MKRKIILLIGLIAMSSIGFSQTRNDFKGPKAKNYQAWKYSVETTDVKIVDIQDEVVKGPKAKNRNQSLQTADATTDENKRLTQNLLNNERLGMVGPKAKNYKIGRE